jgi:hypothetical protein
MGDDYCSGSERRNKGKDKFRKKKLFPYRKGGKFRTREGANEPGVVRN